MKSQDDTKKTAEILEYKTESNTEKNTRPTQSDLRKKALEKLLMDLENSLDEITKIEVNNSIDLIDFDLNLSGLTYITKINVEYAIKSINNYKKQK